MDSLISYMPQVRAYKTELEGLNKQLAKITLTGKISCLEIAETLFDFMEETQGRFAELQHALIKSLAQENVKKSVLICQSRAQVIIDILIRNLFERTADVGFLATDADIREFLQKEHPSQSEIQKIKGRLEEYVKKYSVYEEIVVLKESGAVALHLNDQNPIHRIDTRLLHTTLSTNSDFCEFFGHSELQPKKEHSLIYTAKITKDGGGKGEVIGVLALCFRIEDEMERIFRSLDGNMMHYGLLDQNGRPIIGKNLPKNQKSHNSDEGFAITKEEGREILSVQARSKGYQGYLGLGWIGYASIFLRRAFEDTIERVELREDQFEESPLISSALQDIKLQADDITEGLVDVVINGEIIASKRRAYALNPVLDTIRDISERIHGVITKSIEDIYATIIASTSSDLSFRATLALDIMDRNLYERANDCRWWALTTAFRAALSSEEPKQHKDEMERILAYINNLYTVYTNIFIFDKNGTILAVANPNKSHLIGTVVEGGAYQRALNNTNSQHYFVSNFEKTNHYDGGYTYVYCASILHIEEKKGCVGGIGIVFDAAPQFSAMLQDVSPSSAAMAIFCESSGLIISVMGNLGKKIGDIFEPIKEIGTPKDGGGISKMISMDGKNYLMGANISKGYREYKNSDGYRCDIYCVILLPV